MNDVKEPKQRTLQSHKCGSGMDEAIEIHVLDEPGAGGANHEYLIAISDAKGETAEPVLISFQNGPVGEQGPNGISNEALLAIVKDRLEGFQRGPYACEENATALAGVISALSWLKTRTNERAERGVEGKSTA